MSVSKILFQSNSDEWETPQHIFDLFDSEFNFNLDACASEDNHKCEAFYSKADNGLEKDWGGYRVWCNPPYSKISDWVEKAYRETRKDNTLVVMLLPSRTDTRYFHNYIYQRSEIRFIKGRLRFNESKNTAPFPSMIVIFRGANLER